MPAESVNVRVAERLPEAEGVKAIPTVQLAEAGRLDPQELDWIAKSEELAPDTAMPPRLIADVLPLVRVTICIGLVEPTAVDGNVTLEGATVAVMTDAVPVPVRATV